MVAQAEKLGEHHPDELSPVRHLDSGQLLQRQQVGEVVGHPGEIVHPVGIREELVPGLALADLFRGPVVVADIGVESGDGLAPEGQDKADQPVGADVVRADIQHVLRLLPAARP